jgi:hypothetical protein
MCSESVAVQGHCQDCTSVNRHRLDKKVAGEINLRVILGVILCQEFENHAVSTMDEFCYVHIISLEGRLQFSVVNKEWRNCKHDVYIM